MPLQCALKLADVGHLSTTQEVHKKWTSRLEAEFFAQGDEERKRGMTVSPLMDRHNQTGVSKSQVSLSDCEGAACPLAVQKMLKLFAVHVPCSHFSS